MTVKLYDPGSVIVALGALDLTGYAEGTFVLVDRDEDAYTKKVGADGEPTRTRNRNKCGSITVTLMQTSVSNLKLSAALKADELAENGITAPVIVKDNAGNSLHTAQDAWIRKTPASEYAKEVGQREWVIDTGPMVNVEGGN